MSMIFTRPKFTPGFWALTLITCALFGAAFSYHLTLQGRFESLEQKLDKTTLELQQYQSAQEEMVASKNAAFEKLNQKVSALQSPLGPLAKGIYPVAPNVDEVRRQLILLQQVQQDGNKNLTNYMAQLDDLRQQVQSLKVISSGNSSAGVSGSGEVSKTSQPLHATTSSDSREDVDPAPHVFPRAQPVLSDSDRN